MLGVVLNRLQIIKMAVRGTKFTLDFQAQENLPFRVSEIPEGLDLNELTETLIFQYLLLDLTKRLSYSN